MRKFVLFATVLFCICSCNNSNQKGRAEIRPQFQYTFIDVILDTTSTWTQILDAANTFTDSLSIIAADENNGSNRLAAQEWGYMTVYLLTDLYEKKLEDGEDVKFSDISPILDKINYAASLWLLTNIDEDVYVWRDHYYACHQESEEPVSGFFNFMIKVPEYNPHSKSMRITFPMSAYKDYPPMLAFKYLSDDEDSEADSFDTTLMLGDKIRVRSDINVMFADVDGDVVDLMLKYDFMYVMFKSMESEKGDPVEFEISRVNLSTFKEKWNREILNKSK